ncbi:hypothetical protein LGZ99_15745 [Photorhabdus temperata]|uniref:hypothetical protein n=1 Tax=Photorhabdus temperata TaxID=574560 RepID=UPI00038A117D|nr:hypothetical protein [Photorhabdus temperata]EQC00541.1 hypothetical protein B738_10431 [Photorhabdus temperata subsp. temperata M1021]MCT8348613.1 hypothetical protein [Photorhabdus temperata]
MVNVIPPKLNSLWEPTGWSTWQATGLPEAILTNCRRRPTTGGAGVGEFAEMNDGTQEIRRGCLGDWAALLNHRPLFY